VLDHLRAENEVERGRGQIARRDVVGDQLEAGMLAAQSLCVLEEVGLDIAGDDGAGELG
jgi:hypothetical protein